MNGFSMFFLMFNDVIYCNDIIIMINDVKKSNDWMRLNFC